MSKLTDITQKQLLRGYILNICAAANPTGASPELIVAALKKEGVARTKDDVIGAVDYLDKRGLLRRENIDNSVLGIKRTIVHLTAEGMDVLEGTKTVEGIEL